MALHDYATDVLGSRVGLRLLKTLLLYQGKIFTVRELARIAGISHPQASTVLRELEKRGMVKIQPVGKAYQVSLNRDSYILKSIVEPVFKAEENTLNSLISTIKPFFSDKRISVVAVFGSLARGLEKDTSDIDLLVITEDTEFANECVSRAGIEAFAKFGFPLSPLIMSKARFIRERNTDLVKSILESYVTVYGKDLRKVVENVKAGR